MYLVFLFGLPLDESIYCFKILISKLLLSASEHVHFCSHDEQRSNFFFQLIRILFTFLTAILGQVPDNLLDVVVVS